MTKVIHLGMLYYLDMSYSEGVEDQFEVCYFLTQILAEISTSDQLCGY
jgi:hypothetical protein